MSKKKIEEMLQNTDWIKLNKQQRQYVTNYIHVMKRTGGLGRTLYDCYKEPSQTKHEIWEDWKRHFNDNNDSACLTVVTYSARFFTLAYMEYRLSDKMFYLNYITPLKHLCIPFDTQYILDFFYSSVAMKGQLTDAIRGAAGGRIEIEQGE